MNKFKTYFPNSKIVIWSSDFAYYISNGLGFQFEQPEKVDLVFECTPNMNVYWKNIGVPSVTIPWTISRGLYDRLKSLAGPFVNFNRKKYDFMCLGIFVGEYRQNLYSFITNKGYSLEIGHNHYLSIESMVTLYDKFLNSWITLGTTSHNRPELNLAGQHTFKAHRDSVGIALNSLLIYDNYPQLTEVWDIDSLPLYEFDDFDSILEICDYYKSDLVAYTKLLKKQQTWLENHILDDLIFKNLKKYNIL